MSLVFGKKKNHDTLFPWSMLPLAWKYLSLGLGPSIIVQFFDSRFNSSLKEEATKFLSFVSHIVFGFNVLKYATAAIP